LTAKIPEASIETVTLRRAIEKDPARPAYIISVSGVGYKFDDAGA